MVDDIENEEGNNKEKDDDNDNNNDNINDNEDEMSAFELSVNFVFSVETSISHQQFIQSGIKWYWLEKARLLSMGITCHLNCNKANITT